MADNKIEPLKNALQKLHDACDKLNGENGDRKRLCLFCGSHLYDGTGIVHNFGCPVRDARVALYSQEPQQVVCEHVWTPEVNGDKQCRQCGIMLSEVQPETPDELLTQPEFTENDFIIRLCTIINQLHITISRQLSYSPRQQAELIVTDAKDMGWKSPEQLSKRHQSEAAKTKKLGIEVVELLRTKAEMFIEKEEADEQLSKANARIKELNTQIKALNELCNRQQSNFLKAESELKTWQKFYVADVKPLDTEAAIRADQNKKIGEYIDLY